MHKIYKLRGTFLIKERLWCTSFWEQANRKNYICVSAGNGQRVIYIFSVEHECLWILFPASLTLLLNCSGFLFFFSPPQHILWNNKEQLSVKKKLLYFLNNGKTRNSSGGSEAATRLFEIWCVSPPPPPAVRPALWGISAKWTWTNAVPRPATTALFARILLIATSATAGQVSHSPVFWSSQFALKTSQPESLLFFFLHESFMAEEQMLTRSLWLLAQSAFYQI